MSNPSNVNEGYEPVSFDEFIAAQKLKPGTIWLDADRREAYQAYVQMFYQMPESVGDLRKKKAA